MSITLGSSAEPDSVAMPRFAELLTFIDSACDLDDQKWSACTDCTETCRVTVAAGAHDRGQQAMRASANLALTRLRLRRCHCRSVDGHARHVAVMTPLRCRV